MKEIKYHCVLKTNQIVNKLVTELPLPEHLYHKTLKTALERELIKTQLTIKHSEDEAELAHRVSNALSSLFYSGVILDATAAQSIFTRLIKDAQLKASKQGGVTDVEVTFSFKAT